MLELFLFAASLIGLSVACYTDLKERRVPNKLNLGLIVLGVIAHSANAVISGEYFFLGSYFIVVLGAFAFSWIVWRMGAWAGGDAKLFTALAALNPFNLNYLNNALGLGFYESKAMIFPLTFFVWAVLSMLPYGLFITVRAIAKSKKALKEVLSDLAKKVFDTAKYSSAIVGLNVLLGFLGFSSWLVIPLLFAIPLVKHEVKWAVVGGVFVWALVFDPLRALADLLYVFLALYGFYLALKLYSVSRKYALRETVKVRDLAEGMIPAKSVYLVKGKARVFDGLDMKKVLKHLIHREIGKALEAVRPQGELVVSSSRAAGMDKGEVKKLKELSGKGLLPKTMEVKKSNAFVPAMILGYVIVNVCGDVIWLLL